MGLANDVYAQIGLVMLVGLLGKNAILIVEFAVQRHHEGVSLKEAAIEGGKLRFRPILMTSFAFIAGLIPLVRATGPGAIGNRTIGTTAVGGMLFGTVIGVLVIPGLYYLLQRASGDKKLLQDETDQPPMAHTRIRKFNTKDTYPEQNLDNDLCQAVVTQGERIVWLRGQCPQNLDDAKNIESHDPGRADP
ncbi:MAG: efflux RND transporter permease subunit [Nitrospira sp.]